MAEPVICVEKLGKKYRIGKAEKKADTIMEVILNGLKSPLTNFKQIQNLSKLDGEDDSIFWALRDVNFEVKEGEVLGIIGHNGAGKSTLLKILSQITEPTTGSVRIQGRVAALLEVGTGFHPELTGLENIYMNGTILGMTKREIDSRLDEIVDFSGVEKYLNTPVKFYSSGMRVRLGFAVAAHLEPEILIIDEVLSVGDAEFQKKCLGKMESVASQGRTVLFVSHNLEAIKNLCPKTILLAKGELKMFHETKEVINRYLSHTENSISKFIFWTEEDAPGNEFIKIRSVSLEHSEEYIYINTPFSIIIEFWNAIENLNANISLHFKTITGETVFNAFSQLNPLPCLNKGLCVAKCDIPADFLNNGFYTIQFYIVKDKSLALFDLDNVLRIEVLDDRKDIQWYGKIPGVTRPKLNFHIKNKTSHIP